MNIQQMRYLCEVVRHGCNLSEAARFLHTSQPGISRQIRMLEEELGFSVLNRQGKRIVGLTRQGVLVHATAKQLMGGFNGLKQLSEDHRNSTNGKLTVATTHFHARYTLFDAVLRFRKKHPEVSLILHQSIPVDIARQVIAEEADIGISILPREIKSELVVIPCFTVDRILITPRRHPLLKLRRLSLQEICRYPLIAYDSELGGGWRVLHAFKEKKMNPNVVLTATDVDVIKAYVAAGLGVAVVQAPVYSKAKDVNLRAIDASYLFNPGPSVLMMRPQVYVSELVRDFIREVSPEIDLSKVTDFRDESLIISEE